MNEPELNMADALAASYWLAGNALAVFAAWRLSEAAFGRDRRPQLALSATLIYIATIVGATTILGACGVLKPWLLLTSVSAVCLIGLGLIAAQSARNRKVDSANVSARSGKPRPRRSAQRWWWIAWLLLLACLAGHVVVNGLWAFPTEFDGLAYHIPLIDHWLQAETLFAPDAPMWWTSANAEVVGLWMVAPFSGDFLIALGNLPFLVLWVLAAIEVGRLAGLSVGWRHLAALGMLATHTTLHEAEKAMNDVAVAALFFAAVALCLRYLRSGQRVALALAGVAIGLLGGVKYFALGYALLTGSALIVAALCVFTWRRVAAAAAAMTLAALPFGGYWYLRNLWVTGTPVYPAGEAGTGYPNMWETTFLGNSRPELFELTRQALWKMTGPCHVAAIYVAPIALACLACAAIVRLRRGKREDGAVLLALALLLAGTAAVLACTPFAVEDQPGSLNHLHWGYTPARYGLCFLSMAVLSFTWLLQRAAEHALRFIRRSFVASERWHLVASATLPSFFMGAVAFQWFQLVRYIEHHRGYLSTQDLVSAGLVAANIAGCMWLGVELYPWAVRRRAIALSVATVVSVGAASAGVASLSQHWHEGFAIHFNVLYGTKVFSELPSDLRSLRIAVLDHRPYPFFGSARQYRVCTPHRLTTYDELTDYLSLRQPDLVISPLRNTGNIFERYKEGPEWLLNGNDARFKRLPIHSGHFAMFSFSPSERSLGTGDIDRGALQHARSTAGVPR